MEDKPLVIIIVAAGLFSCAASAANWNWFFTHRKAAFLVKLLGRGGARVFYFALGGVLAGFGLKTALGY